VLFCLCHSSIEYLAQLKNFDTEYVCTIVGQETSLPLENFNGNMELEVLNHTRLESSVVLQLGTHPDKPSIMWQSSPSMRVSSNGLIVFSNNYH
jgi:hypothetical protein